MNRSVPKAYQTNVFKGFANLRSVPKGSEAYQSVPERGEAYQTTGEKRTREAREHEGGDMSMPWTRF